MANPKVELRQARRNLSPHGEWVVWCRTGDCQYADTSLYKSTAQALQRKHVRDHRRNDTGGVR